MARNPPSCPAEKRSLGDRRMWCSAQVRLRMDVRGDSISLCEISPGIGWRADYMQLLLLRSVHEDTVGTPYNTNVGVQKIPDRAIWKPVVAKRNNTNP